MVFKKIVIIAGIFLATSAQWAWACEPGEAVYVAEQECPNIETNEEDPFLWLVNLGLEDLAFELSDQFKRDLIKLKKMTDDYTHGKLFEKKVRFAEDLNKPTDNQQDQQASSSKKRRRLALK